MVRISLRYFALGRVRKNQRDQQRYTRPQALDQLLHSQHQQGVGSDFTSELDGSSQRLVQLLIRNSSTPMTTNNRIEVLGNGEEKFRELCAAFESAEHHIHLEYYTLKNDGLGREILALLERKSRSGVQVRVILDAIGSRGISKRYLSEMRRAGIEVAQFSPLTLPHVLKINYRNHRKIVVVDGQIGFVGGMNIGDDYLSLSKKWGHWRDTHLRLEGESVRVMQDTFLSDWHYLTGQTLTSDDYYPPIGEVGQQLVQIVSSGPDSEWKSIQQLFFMAVSSAKKRVYIQSPYFVPCQSTYMAIKTAALSGVDIRIIVQGLSNAPLADWAAGSYFEELLKAGVKVYKYQKGLLHTKVLIVDDGFATVGSANFDNRSFFINLETNAVLYDAKTVSRLEQDFLQDIDHSLEVEFDTFTIRPLSSRIKEGAAKLLSPLL